MGKRYNIGVGNEKGLDVVILGLAGGLVGGDPGTYVVSKFGEREVGLKWFRTGEGYGFVVVVGSVGGDTGRIVVGVSRVGGERSLPYGRVVAGLGSVGVSGGRS